MKLYIKQRVFSFADKFDIYDQFGNPVYTVEGKLFSIGKKLYVFDNYNREVAYIEQKVLSFLPRYFVFTNGEQRAEIVKNFTFFRHKYTVEGLGWEVNGNFLAHDYEVTVNGIPVVTITKQWLSFGDCYELDIADGEDVILAVSVVLAIDCAMEQANSNNN